MRRWNLTLAVALAASLVGLPSIGAARGPNGGSTKRLRTDSASSVSSHLSAEAGESARAKVDTKSLSTTPSSPPEQKSDKTAATTHDGQAHSGSTGGASPLLDAALRRSVRSTSTRSARGIRNDKIKAPHGSADEKATEAFFAAYDAKVQEAFKYVISVPSLGAYRGIDGHTARWATMWQAHLDGKPVDGMAAEFGYVIESLVSGDNAPFRADPPEGYSVASQVTVGGTRPDLVLLAKNDSRQVAWLDVTASKSEGHIFEKDSWDRKGVSFAEVTYPSLEEHYFEAMRENRDNTSPISEEEFDQKMAAAKSAYEAKKSQWTTFGQQLKDGLRDVKPKGDRPDLDERRQEAMQEALQLPGRPPVDLKLIPSILKAMGIGPKSWGFGTGFSENEKAGERWLDDNFEALQQARAAATGPSRQREPSL
jgi:hypothetical protein